MPEWNMAPGSNSDQYEEWAGFTPSVPYNVRVCDRCGCDRHKDDMQDWGDQQLCLHCIPKCFCGAPMLKGGEGGCRDHEIDAWLETLAKTEGVERIAIVTRLIELGWVAA